MMSVSWWLPWVICYVCLPLLTARLEPPGMLNECYASAGDVLFGLTVAIRQTDGDNVCGDQLDVTEIQVTEAFVWSLAQINKNQSILPNITVGFAVLDNCGEVVTALSRNIYFLPDDEMIPPTLVQGNCSQQIPNFEVVAVVSPFRSIQSVLVAPILSIFNIPTIGTVSTSDDLSDKTRYEYFLRVVPPDHFQTDAMLDLLTYMNWTYFSVVFSEGNYGENGAKYLQKGADSRGLCIAYSQMVYADSTAADFINIITELILYGNARAVVLFMENTDLEKFFPALEHQNISNRFVWIGSDTFGYVSYGTAANGGIAFHFSSGVFPQFDDYYLSLNPVDDSVSPWLKLKWEDYLNCSWTDPDRTPCDTYADETLYDHELINGGRVYKMIDATFTLAYGLDSLIRAQCPEAFMDAKLLENCIVGEEYLQHLKATQFKGITGEISIDENGDALPQYVLRQYLSENPGIGSEVGTWNQKSGGLTLDMDAIDWTVFTGLVDDRVKSVCSDPCPPRHRYFPNDQVCCWECKLCRDNEVLVDNNTECEACGANTWPDAATATECVAIPPVYLEWSSSLGAALAVINTLGSVLAIITGVLFVRYRHEKLIKASSRELIAVIMTGICMAHVIVYIILSKPTDASCPLQAAGFNVSVTIIFAPLLVKNSRVYRIFKAGGKGIKAPPFISTRSQVVLTVLLILIQVLVCLVTGVFLPLRAQLRMPVLTEEYVELYCNSPLASLIISISYNLILLIACAMFGFMTRKLPENFNESWYIFVSVSTTMFMWLVFLPTYFTTFRAHHQVVLLATCLFLNATITLLCLFAPKLYALFCVEDEKLKFATMSNPSTVAPSVIQSG